MPFITGLPGFCPSSGNKGIDQRFGSRRIGRQLIVRDALPRLLCRRFTITTSMTSYTPAVMASASRHKSIRLMHDTPASFTLKKGVSAYTLVLNHAPINAKVIGTHEHESHYV